jgi:hypothetical protein
MAFCVRGCGSTKIENRDTGTCATCNKADRQAEKPVVVKERKGLKPVSDKRAKKLVSRAKAYKQVKEEQPCCACCGSRWRLTPSHVLSQGQFGRHMDNPCNLITLCQVDHNLWEHYKDKFAVMFPDVWNEKMKIMQELEPQEFERFKANHPNLF